MSVESLTEMLEKAMDGGEMGRKYLEQVSTTLDNDTVMDAIGFELILPCVGFMGELETALSGVDDAGEDEALFEAAATLLARICSSISAREALLQLETQLRLFHGLTWDTLSGQKRTVRAVLDAVAGALAKVQRKRARFLADILQAVQGLVCMPLDQLADSRSLDNEYDEVEDEHDDEDNDDDAAFELRFAKEEEDEVRRTLTAQQRRGWLLGCGMGVLQSVAATAGAYEADARRTDELVQLEVHTVASLAFAMLDACLLVAPEAAQSNGPAAVLQEQSEAIVDALHVAGVRVIDVLHAERTPRFFYGEAGSELVLADDDDDSNDTGKQQQQQQQQGGSDWRTEKQAQRGVGRSGWNMAGMCAFVLVECGRGGLVLPSMLTASHKLRLLMPLVSHLFNGPLGQQASANTLLHLASHGLDTRRCIDTWAAEWLSLLQGLVNLMCLHGDEDTRMQAYSHLEALFSAMTWSSVLSCASHLVQHCPFQGVQALMLQKCMQGIDAAFRGDDNAAAVFHNNQRVATLLVDTLQVADDADNALLLENADLYACALNVIRYLALRDADTNLTHLRDARFSSQLNEAFLRPLARLVRRVIDANESTLSQLPQAEEPESHDHAHDHEHDDHVHVTERGEGLVEFELGDGATPELSDSQRRSLANKTVAQAYVLESLLEMIGEL